MTATPPLDTLIARLRERAADPARRTTVRENQLSRSMRGMDLGGMLSLGRGLGSMLKSVVAANQEVASSGRRRATDRQDQQQADDHG